MTTATRLDHDLPVRSDWTIDEIRELFERP